MQPVLPVGKADGSYSASFNEICEPVKLNGTSGSQFYLCVLQGFEGKHSGPALGVVVCDRRLRLNAGCGVAVIAGCEFRDDCIL
jgi:hypothetical protein